MIRHVGSFIGRAWSLVRHLQGMRCTSRRTLWLAWLHEVWLQPPRRHNGKPMLPHPSAQLLSMVQGPLLQLGSLTVPQDEDDNESLCSNCEASLSAQGIWSTVSTKYQPYIDLITILIHSIDLPCSHKSRHIFRETRPTAISIKGKASIQPRRRMLTWSNRR